MRLGRKVFKNGLAKMIVRHKEKQKKMVLLGGKTFKMVWLAGKAIKNGLARKQIR